MSKMNLAKLFNKFAGKEIAVTETKRTIVIGGETHTVDEARFADQNPTLEAMKKTAENHGLKLRISLPNSFGTCDFRTDRVNAHVEKGADGKWRVGKKFHIG